MGFPSLTSSRFAMRAFFSCRFFLVALLVPTMAFPLDVSPLSLAKDTGTAREYYSSNRDRRFLVRIQVWGDTPLSGIHYVPDNSTLLDVVGLAGGPSGNFDNSTITLMRGEGEKNTAPTISILGKELVTTGKYRDMKINNGDVIHLEAGQKSDTFMRTLTITSSILALIGTAATLYLIGRKN